MNVLQLKTLWDCEKEKFKHKELGGLQNFVRKVLECVELFNIQEGKEATAPHERKNVYIQEDTDNKDRGRPDFVLYLDINQTQIKIPIEVEKHENIKAGKKQIENYKGLYNAVYAILTDGYEWQFYKGEFVTKKLKLDEILEDTSIFRTFWDEYIKPDTYYVSFFESMQNVSLFELEGLEVEENRVMFFDDITKLIRDFKNKLRLSEYFIYEKTPDKVATEISYAYLIQFILYKTLVDNEYSDKKKEFKGRFKEVYKSLKAEIFGEILTQATHIAEYISENLYKPFAVEQKYIEERLKEIKKQTKKSISDISAWLDIFIFIKKYNFSSVQNELFGYIYENYLKELYEDKNKGQYFTDPAVVEFMLDEIGYTVDEIKKRVKDNPDNPNISIIDPSCGSGTFLYSAAKRIIDAIYRGDESTAKLAENLICENIFGLDIEEFPLYLAEMGILMKMLPLIVNEKYNNPIDKKIKLFKTEDSISEFVDMMHSISEKGGQKELFASHKLEVSKFMRDEDNLAEMKNSMRPPRRRFDFVIGNPPYIGYNECCKQKILIFTLIKNGNFKLNDVYGVNLHSTPYRIKKSPPKPNFYSFFIALGISLLKDNSKISFIIPQTILTAGDLDVIRYHLSRYTQIEKIITFEGKMFIGRGLKQDKPVATSSLVFIIKRTEAKIDRDVKICNYQDLSSYSDFINIFNKKIVIKSTSQNELLKNHNNWNYIKLSDKLLKFYCLYKKFDNNLSIYFDHDSSHDIFKSNFYFDIGYNIDEKNILKDPINNDDYYVYPKLKREFYNIKGIKGYFPKSHNNISKYKIELLRNNQGYNLLNSKYKIIWSYVNFNQFYFTDKPIIWARNQICGIGSNNKKELLYLFAILNSNFTNIILYVNLKTKDEKDYLVSINSIKEFVRIPKITQDNQFIKDEIIIKTEEMLDLEDCQLKDFVDFSDITKQKFDSVEVCGNNVVLTKDGEVYKAPIKNKKQVVVEAINEKFGCKNLLPNEVLMSDLKHCIALDRELQNSLKDYIDDLVFALYFNIPIKKVDFNLAEDIKALCRQNEFYDYIQDETKDLIKV